MKRILVLLFVLSVALSGIYAVTATDDNVKVELDLMKLTGDKASVVIGFSKNEVTDFTTSVESYSDGYSLVPDATTGIASNEASQDKLYVYARITSADGVDVYLKSKPLDGYTVSGGTSLSAATLDWSISGDSDFSVSFDSEKTSEAIITHLAGSADSPVSQVYCKQLTIKTDDFRPISKQHEANYWEQNLVVTINSGS